MTPKGQSPAGCLQCRAKHAVEVPLITSKALAKEPGAQLSTVSLLLQPSSGQDTKWPTQLSWTRAAPQAAALHVRAVMTSACEPAGSFKLPAGGGKLSVVLLVLALFGSVAGCLALHQTDSQWPTLVLAKCHTK